MLIKRLTAKNWTCHHKLDLEFKPGLNGCLGANGTGKSAILDALRFAITGETIAAGKYEDNIMLGQKTAFVTAEFEHGDTSYTITRKLSPNRQELSYNGLTFTKVAEIESRLVDILGAKMDALLNNVFVGQHAIDSILFKTNTERLKEFQDTFGLTRLSDAYKMLSAEVSSCHVTAGLREQRDLVVEAAKLSTVELKEHREALEKLERQVAEIMPIIDNITKHDQMLSLRALRTQSEVVLARIQAEMKALNDVIIKQDIEALTVKQQIADGAADASTATMTLSKHQQKLGTRNMFASELQKAQAVIEPQELPENAELVAKLATSVAKLKAILAGTEARPKLPAEQQLEVEMAEIDKELAKLKEPDPKLGILQSDMKREQHTLDTFASGSCPTCLRPMEAFDASAIQAKIANLKAAITDLASQRQTLLKLLTDKHHSISATLAQHKATAETMLKAALTKQQGDHKIASDMAAAQSMKVAAFAAAQKRIVELQQSLSEIQTNSDEDVLKMEKIVAEHAALIEKLRTSNTTLEGSRSKFASLTAEAKRVNESMPQFNGSGLMSDDEYKQAKEMQSALNTHLAQLRERQTKVGITDAKLQAQLRSVDDMNQRLDSESKMAKWSSLCLRARDIVHVSGLPTLMMKEYAARINTRIAYYMKVWESPFRFFLDDTLSFKAVFDDGTEMLAARLSGGQKIVASTSFRLAMSDTFAKGVGLLILDEPTNHLDADNITHLQQLLLRLKQLAGSSRRQIIIVTHAEQLTGFFDNTIRLLPHKIT